MDDAYGTWPSPITAESLTAEAIQLGDPVFDRGAHRNDLYWLQADPTDGGRVSLWCHQDGSDREITVAPHNVRSRVHEYGGGPFAVADGMVVFSDLTDNRLHLITPDDPTPRPLTSDSALRYGGLQLHPDRDLIIAVREDHRAADHEADDQPVVDHEPQNTIIARRLSDPAEVEDRVLCSGADFYGAPQLSPDGRLAWVEWQHPAMPWDSTLLKVAAMPPTAIGTDRSGPIELEPRTADPLPALTVAGGNGESIAVPSWTADGSLIFVSDRTDWWNLYRWRADSGEPTPLCPMEAEFAPPQWVLGGHPYVIIDADRIACSINQSNRSRVAVLTVSTGQLADLDTGAVDVGSLSCNGEQLSCRLGYPDRPAEIVIIDLAPAGTITLRLRTSAATPPKGLTSTANEVSWQSDLGTVHGWFYPPTNDGVTPPKDELPPLITISHGGPTGSSSPVYDPEISFWTSRGIAVLDVNYGGSTGYGRRYRDRLRRGWGVVDVADCADGARALIDQGLVDPRRIAIQGRSAGGYTTLRALTATDVFTAGISHFGIGDLTALVADTHKFESRYPESLIGAWPEEAQRYAELSPINHVDQLDAPILLTQGTEDKVVPPNQAETFARAARTKGLPVALIMYPGEGHGFRRSENIIDSQQSALAFLGRVFGFTPADDLPELEIENLPPS